MTAVEEGVQIPDIELTYPDPTHSIVYITDFNDQDAPGRCISRLRAEFNKNGTKFQQPDVFVSDIHRGNILHGAFRLREQQRIRVAEDAGSTVYIGVVDPGVGTERAGIVIETEKGNWYVGPDNGLLTPAANNEGVINAWKIKDEIFNKDSATFHGLTVFTPVGAALASGRRPEDIDGWFENFDINALKQTEFKQNQVVDIDGYGNVVVNTTLPTRPWDGSREELPTKLSLRHSHRWRRGGNLRLGVPVVDTFEAVRQRQFLAYPGSNEGRVELAVRIDPTMSNDKLLRRSAAGRTGVTVGEVLDIRPKFKRQSGTIWQRGGGKRAA